MVTWYIVILFPRLETKLLYNFMLNYRVTRNYSIVHKKSKNLPFDILSAH